jgi:hypothetical protein
VSEHDNNPRVFIQSTDLERTLRYVELLEEEVDLDEDVKNVLAMLGDCLPMGSKRDERGASLKQVKYICLLAGFDGDQARQFCRVINLAGGMDSLQAHHLITKLEPTRNRFGRS